MATISAPRPQARPSLFHDHHHRHDDPIIPIHHIRHQMVNNDITPLDFHPRTLTSTPTTPLPPRNAILPNATTAALSTAALYPLSLIITRLQVQRDLQSRRRQQKHGKHVSFTQQNPHEVEPEYANLLDCARKIYATEGGLRAFYAGFKEACGQAVADAVVYLLAYNLLRSKQSRGAHTAKTAQAGTTEVRLSARDDMVVGMLAECIAKLVSTPVGVVLARRQVENFPGGVEEETNVKSARATARQIVAEHGASGLWAGYGASCVLALTPGVAAVVAGGIRRAQASRPSTISCATTTTVAQDKRTDKTTALSIALGKLIAACLMYPFNVAKARAQISARRYSGPRKYKSSLRTVVETALTRGIGALYDGLAGELLRGLITHGVGVLAAEVVRRALLVGYVWALRVRMALRPGKPVLAAPAARSSALETIVGRAKEASRELAAQTARFAESVVTVFGVGSLSSTSPRVVDEGFVPTAVPPCDVPWHAHKCECVNEELAEMVNDYVDEDEEVDWRSLYRDHWLW